MQNRDVFSGYHPLVTLLYFVLVLFFTMCLQHPVSLLSSLLAAMLYTVQLNGGAALCKSLRYLLPMLLLAMVLNPAFNHAGVTILCYLPGGNPLTLESILYGVAAAVMLVSVLVWFHCYNVVMTSDKFIYLFGRIIPALSLVLSMTLRFVPRFQAQLRQVVEAQRCLGRDVRQGTLPQRLKQAVQIVSILVTWAMENAIETADSMKSRGYGLPGRTAFAVYRWERRDAYLLCWLLGCGLVLLCGWLSGGLSWHYYPMVQQFSLTPLRVGMQFLYLLLCLTPIWLHRKEEWLWQRIRFRD